MKYVRIQNFSKEFHSMLGERKKVFVNCDFKIDEGESVGLLGLNGTGKTTLCNIISGAESLTTGRVERNGTISWPIGIFSSLVPTLTGKQNIYFLSDLLGANKSEIFEIVKENSELGDDLNARVATYSAGMKSKLAFFLSLSFKFDFLIFDEVISVGDSVFRKKAAEYFRNLRDNSSILLCSHNMNTIRENCNKCYVIHDKKISQKYDMDEGVRFYEEIIKSKQSQ